MQMYFMYCNVVLLCIDYAILNDLYILLMHLFEGLDDVFPEKRAHQSDIKILSPSPAVWVCFVLQMTAHTYTPVHFIFNRTFQDGRILDPCTKQKCECLLGEGWEGLAAIVT